MDAILGRVTQSAFNYALKSGVPIVAGFTFRQCSRLLQETPKGQEREQIARLQSRLEGKIKIVSPAIDMIELISARGNTSLESAVSLTRDIRLSIQELGVRLSEVVEQDGTEPASRRKIELLHIISDMEDLLQKIDDAVPLINLAITTSGVTSSSTLSQTISPSRLLQASTFLTDADARYVSMPDRAVQVGPVFTVTLYMLFAGHSMRLAKESGARDTIWKEVMHKAQVKLTRLPLSSLNTPSKRDLAHKPSKGKSFEGTGPATEYAYQLSIVEDLDDGRVHDFDGTQPGPFDSVLLAGIREMLPVHEIAKIFYADTGKILNIQSDSDESRPILLLKRDLHAEPPRRMFATDQRNESPAVPSRQGSDDLNKPYTPTKPLPQPKINHTWKLPNGLDPEWMAFEVYRDDEAALTDDSDITDDEDSPVPVKDSQLSLLAAFTKLALPLQSSPMSLSSSSTLPKDDIAVVRSESSRTLIKTTLSLLEMLLKLTALQQFRQEPHLAIEDELLNLFLQDTSTTGHGQEKVRRQRIRREAVERVGFDPYDESPVKMRHMSKIEQRTRVPSASDQA